MKNRLITVSIALYCFALAMGQVPVKTIPFSNTTYGVDISSDGSMIFVAGKDSIGYILDSNGSILTRLTGHNHSVSSIDYFKEKQTVLTGAYDNTAILWNTNGKRLATLSGHTKGVISVTQNERFLATASRDQTVKIWNRNGTLHCTLTDHTGQVNAIEFVDEMEWIVTASFDQTIKIWNFQGQLLKTMKGHESGIRSIAIAVKSRLIIAGHQDGKISMLDFDGKLLLVIDGHGTDGEAYKIVNELAFTATGEYFISCGADGKIKIRTQEGIVVDEVKAVIDPDVYVSGIGLTDEVLVSSQGGSEASVKIWNFNSFNLKPYTCNNTSYAFLRQTLGSWKVKTKDRLSPGEYEENTGKAIISPAIEGCGISISYEGTYRNKPYARSVGIVGKDSVSIQMVALDSEHGSYSVLEGSIVNDQLVVYWFRDKEKKRLQSKYIMTFANKDAFEFSSYLSQDYGETWALTHERKYSRE
ncbi:MAG: WD40 repeat domain-containing protein [Cyclobacteriaceae bacterium]